MLSQKFKEEAMCALDDMSAEEIISVLEKIGSVQEDSVAMAIPLPQMPKFDFSKQDNIEIVVKQEFEIKTSLQYRFDFSTIDIFPRRGKAA